MAYVRTRLGRWFYEEAGPSHGGAPPAGGAGETAIVLWHSFLCDGGMWKHQVRPLAALGRVIVFDGPGHGKSEVPPPFTLESNAEALVDALDALGVRRVVMHGLSWGGMVAMRLALSHPERVLALGLLDTSADRPPPRERYRYAALFSFARRLGFPPFLVRHEGGPAMFGPKTLAERPELLDAFVRTMSGFPWEGTYLAGRAIMVERRSILDRLTAIRCPTLVMCGRDDGATPPACSERIAAAIAGAHLEWVEGAGHLSALEEPEAVTRTLVDFTRAVLESEPSRRRADAPSMAT